jgi:hypothetical protein
MDKLKKHFSNELEAKFIRYFTRLSARAKVKYLKKIDPTHTRYLVSFMKKIRSKKLPYLNSSLHWCKAYKKKFNWLVRQKLNPANEKILCRKFRKQSGGFWGVLLASVLPIALDYIYKRMNKA